MVYFVITFKFKLLLKKFFYSFLNQFVQFQKHFFQEKVGGPLFNRYNNQLKVYRDKLGFAYKNKRSATSTLSKEHTTENCVDENTDPPSEEHIYLIEKLNCYDGMWSIYKVEWEKVFHIRCQDSKALSFSEFLNKWPILSNAKIALHLVSITRDLI